jgi:hypothetical protein
MGISFFFADHLCDVAGRKGELKRFAFGLKQEKSKTQCLV